MVWGRGLQASPIQHGPHPHQLLFCGPWSTLGSHPARYMNHSCSSTPTLKMRELKLWELLFRSSRSSSEARNRGLQDSPNIALSSEVVFRNTTEATENDSSGWYKKRNFSHRKRWGSVSPREAQLIPGTQLTSEGIAIYIYVMAVTLNIHRMPRARAAAEASRVIYGMAVLSSGCEEGPQNSATPPARKEWLFLSDTMVSSVPPRQYLWGGGSLF